MFPAVLTMNKTDFVRVQLLDCILLDLSPLTAGRGAPEPPTEDDEVSAAALRSPGKKISGKI